MNPEENMLGGEFVHPDASLEAKRAILASRALLYSGEEGMEGEALKRAITGGKTLVDGAAPIIAMILSGVEQKLGDLSDADLLMVVPHLAGTIVEVAKEQGDPEAMEDEGKAATFAIIEAAMDIMMDQGMIESKGEQPMPQGPQAPQGPAPLMQSAGGGV